MKYTYRNIKHVVINGVKPGEEITLNHEMIGGGFKLVEVVEEKQKNKKNRKKSKGDEN